ncbi:MAG: helix-turn-helix domain-containing protein [Solirubrobacterales bacterium]
MGTDWQLEFEYDEYAEDDQDNVGLRSASGRDANEKVRTLAADLIREIESERRRRGVSKADLARKIGKQPAAVRRLLTTECNPELYTLIELADALGLHVTLSRRRGRPPGSR